MSMEEDDLGDDGMEPTLLFTVRGLDGTTYLVCGAGSALDGMTSEIEASALEDLDLLDEPPDGVGFWVWEGRLGLDDEDDAITEGDWRRPSYSEAMALAEGRDPWPEGPGTWWE